MDKMRKNKKFKDITNFNYNKQIKIEEKDWSNEALFNQYGLKNIYPLNNENHVFENRIKNHEDKSLNGVKDKVAPRSSAQFKIGPSFDNTTLFKPIFIESTNENIFPFVNARIDRGFDFVNGEWIGYKRNYFTLVAAFEFENKDSKIFAKERFYSLDDNDNPINIKCFALRLVSKCCEDNIEINLIQHTAKRDRGPQYMPPVYPAITGQLPSHNIVKLAANIRNENKIDLLNEIFYLDISKLGLIQPDCILSTYPNSKISTVARYERIQFSSSIHYRKSSLTNKHFTLQVELLGLVDDGNYTILAQTETPPLIVRGRSPSNYQLSKKNTVPVISDITTDRIAKKNYDLSKLKKQKNSTIKSNYDTDNSSYEKNNYFSENSTDMNSVFKKAKKLFETDGSVIFTNIEKKKSNKRGRKKKSEIFNEFLTNESNILDSPLSGLGFIEKNINDPLNNLSPLPPFKNKLAFKNKVLIPELTDLCEIKTTNSDLENISTIINTFNETKIATLFKGIDDNINTADTIPLNFFQNNFNEIPLEKDFLKSSSPDFGDPLNFALNLNACNNLNSPVYSDYEIKDILCSKSISKKQKLFSNHTKLDYFSSYFDPSKLYFPSQKYDDSYTCFQDELLKLQNELKNDINALKHIQT